VEDGGEKERVSKEKSGEEKRSRGENRRILFSSLGEMRRKEGEIHHIRTAPATHPMPLPPSGRGHSI
jgi:hypothetical protein